MRKRHKWGKVTFTRAHNHSRCHKLEVSASVKAGCFYCLSIFPPSEIKEWHVERRGRLKGRGSTALCPKCGIDSVIGSNSGFSITKEFLARMYEHWFGARNCYILWGKRLLKVRNLSPKRKAELRRRRRELL